MPTPTLFPHKNSFRRVRRNACVAPIGLGLLLAPGDLHAQAGKGKRVQFSNLSDGDFEKQLEAPESEPLAPNSLLMLKAMESYTNLPFDVGERMRFAITYLGVKGGTAEVFLRSPVKAENSPGGWAHRITGEVRSAEWYKWITRVHDAVEGLMDSSPELVPLRFYINQQEGSFRQSKIVEFSAKEGKIRQRTQRKDRELKRDEFPFSANTKDALGALFYFRSKVPPTGNVKSFDFPVFTSEKTWVLKARLDKQETLKIDGVKFDTDMWQVTSHFGGLMEQKGDIRMWITRDARRLPIYAEANVKFGYLKLHLAEWDQGWTTKGKTAYEKIRLDP